MDRAEQLIASLELLAHPEGGYFKEVYRSHETVAKDGLASRYSGGRSISTSIYFLLTGDNKSHFHKVLSDETWHFYEGSTIKLHIISQQGNYQSVLVGPNLQDGDAYQYTVLANQWFAAEVVDKSSYGLVGCTVAPGFDFDDFQLASKEFLLQLCPSQEEIIKEFCLS